MKITHNGKTLETKEDFELLSEEEYEQIKKDWEKSPNYEDVQIEMVDLIHGSTKIANITSYYFRKLMDNTVKYSSKWSINEVIENRELLSLAVAKTLKNKVFFDGTICENIDKVFRCGGCGFSAKASQFPVKMVDKIIYEYNVNNKWYDYSCGWGGRLSGALKNNIEYFGTDPNYLLVDKLKEFYADFRCTVGKRANATIKCQGSEIFVPEWENKIGLAFSSPPYFSLEDYRIGNQSYKAGTSYSQWINNYLKPTIENIYRYLVEDGYFVCNIKDFDKYTLEKDTIETAEQCGFELFKVDKFEGALRATGKNGDGENVFTDQSENMFVFIKKGATPHMCHDEQISLF